MKRIIEITIITTILFSLAFCFGCKDKAEAYEPNEPECKHARIVGYSQGFGSSIYCSICLKTFEEKPEPNEPECKHQYFGSCLVADCNCVTCCIHCGKPEPDKD